MPTRARTVMRALLFLVLPLAGAAAIAGCGGDSVKTTVNVTLQEWQVSPSATTVEAGKIKFLVTNNGTMTHELAVVQVDADGNKREVAEVEDVEKGTNAEFTAKLKAGTYQLACLIVPGEAGSTMDHYQQGMHTEFIVK